MTKESISNVDLAMLRMDIPNNLMIITGLMILDSQISVGKLKSVIEPRLLKYARFHRRVVESPYSLRRPYWEDDPEFDIDNHIVRIDLKIPANQGLLKHLIGEMMSIPLDPSRPLWKFFLIEKYGEGSALICRFHHSIADGIALMRVLISMTEVSPDGHTLESLMASTTTSQENTKYGQRRRAPKRLQNGAKLTKKVLKAGVTAINDPDKAKEDARKSVETAIAMARFVLRTPDPKTHLKGELGPKKLAIWSQPIPLQDIKSIGRAYGATVNDVLMTITAGALRRYLIFHGEDVDRGNIHSFIPVNLRPEELNDQLGNQFGLVFLGLAIEKDDPIERLYKIKENMDDLKSSPEAVATMGLFYLLGAIPRFQNIVISIFDSKGTAVTTNVPGPQIQLYLAGSPINTLMAWVPKSGHVGLGMSILSYNGNVNLGITTDEKLVPDPERILEYFEAELETLKKLASEEKAKPDKSFSSMLKQLDQAINNLDDILEAPDNGRSSSDPTPTPDRCQAQTRSGRQCKNKPLYGLSTCRVHTDKKP